MSKKKRKLTPEQRRSRKDRRENHILVFVDGKQRYIKQCSTEEQELLRFAESDPIYLHQEGLHWLMPDFPGWDDDEAWPDDVEVDESTDLLPPT